MKRGEQRQPDFVGHVARGEGRSDGDRLLERGDEDLLRRLEVEMTGVAIPAAAQPHAERRRHASQDLLGDGRSRPGGERIDDRPMTREPELVGPCRQVRERMERVGALAHRRQLLDVMLVVEGEAAVELLGGEIAQGDQRLALLAAVGHRGERSLQRLDVDPALLEEKLAQRPEAAEENLGAAGLAAPEVDPGGAAVGVHAQLSRGAHAQRLHQDGGEGGGPDLAPGEIAERFGHWTAILPGFRVGRHSQRFVEGDPRGGRQVEGAQTRALGDTDRVLPVAREEIRGKTHLLRSEDQRVAGPEIGLPQAPGSIGGEEVHAGPGRPRLPRLEVRVDLGHHLVPIVEAGAAQVLVGNRESQGLDQVELGAGHGAEPGHVARVGRDSGMDEHDGEGRIEGRQHGRILQRRRAEGEQTQNCAFSHEVRAKESGPPLLRDRFLHARAGATLTCRDRPTDPPRMRAIDERSGRVLARRVVRAERFFSRLRGLLGRRSLEAGEALLLVPCGSIHTLGMRFSIDALFLDGDGVVLHALADLRPWRVPKGVRGARMVLELPAGTLAPGGTPPGSRVRFEAPHA